MPSEMRELFAWKYSECPECHLRNKCLKKVDNLRNCLQEDQMEADTESLGYFVKRVLRFVLSRPTKKGSIFKRSGVLRTVEPIEKRPEAVLYCADRDEFSGCRR